MVVITDNSNMMQQWLYILAQHSHYINLTNQPKPVYDILSYIYIHEIYYILHVHEFIITKNEHIPDSKVHGANMRPTWVLSAPDGPHGDPMRRAIRDGLVAIVFVMVIL